MGRNTLGWQTVAAVGVLASVFAGATFAGLTPENAGGFTCAFFSAWFFLGAASYAKTGRL